VPACDGRTDGQTDGRTDLLWLIQRSAQQAMLTRCKNTKTHTQKPLIEPKPVVPNSWYTSKNSSLMWRCLSLQLWYTIQHWTILKIFPLILQTIITAQSIRRCLLEGRGETDRQTDNNSNDLPIQSRPSPAENDVITVRATSTCTLINDVIATSYTTTQLTTDWDANNVR